MATFPGKRTPDQRSFATCTISTEAAGLSDVIDCGGLTLAVIEMSSDWTDAPISFLGSIDSTAATGGMHTIYRAASTGAGTVTEISYVTTADRLISIDPALFWGIRYLQLRSGSSSTGVTAQAAPRTLLLGLAAYQPIK
jgi:hypothetical protein